MMPMLQMRFRNSKLCPLIDLTWQFSVFMTFKMENKITLLINSYILL